jgi:feruloyl esterase
MCLNTQQLEAVKKIYAGPSTSTGEKLSMGGPMPGSELSWIEWFLPSAFSEHISKGDSMTDIFTREWFSYLAFMPDAGPNWTPNDFNFDRDYKRFMLVESLYSDSNPDMRRFKAAGGKLLMYSGWNDPDATPGGIIDYYETAERTLGGRSATQEFFRLFMVPGMSHCSTGAGPFDIDYLHYMEAWVERGAAPDVVIGSESRSGVFVAPSDADRKAPLVKRTRPVFPYPIQSKYTGLGDPNDAASWVAN